MPIKSLETKDASFPRLGKIKKGAEKPKSGPGKDLDYFRIDTQRQDVRDAVLDVYGAEPRELRVWLPHSEVDENFDPWMKEYTGGSLERQCDGENQHVWMEGGKIKSVNQGCEPISCVRETTGCQCKQTAHLHVMIDELFRQGIVGYFAVETHSINDIITITSNLRAAYAMRPNLCGIPFILRRQMQSISTPRGENRVRTDKSLLSLEPDPSWVQAQLQRTYQAALRFGVGDHAIAHHSTGATPGSGSYLLPGHYADEAASSGLPVASAVVKPVPKAVYSNPDNVKRLGVMVSTVLGLPNEDARRVRIGMMGSDRSVASYSQQEILELRAALFVERVKDFECWNHFTHARNAFKAFSAGKEEWGDQELFDAWLAEAMERCDKVTTPAIASGAELEVEAIAV